MYEENEESHLARVAWLYYHQGLTQEEIAKQLGYSRTKIVRMLAKARAMGLVRIEITSPFKACLEMENRLKKRFVLHEAVVVPTGRDEQVNKAGIGKAGAFLLERILRDGDIIGAGWGTTIFELGRYLAFPHERNLTLVQLMGGLNVIGGHTPLEIVKLLATGLKARGFWLNTPFVVDTPSIKEAILSDVGIKQVMETAKMMRVALVSIGDVGEKSLWITAEVFSRGFMIQLRAKGAVGDILVPSQGFNTSDWNIEPTKRP